MISTARASRKSAGIPAEKPAVPAVPNLSGVSAAVVAAVNAVRRDPGSPALRHALADILRAAAFLREAVIAYEAVIALDPTAGTAYRDMGNVLTDLGRDDDGLRALTRAVELMPDEPGALLGLIRTYSKLRAPHRARPYVARLQQAAGAHPRDARRRLYAGLALSQVGQPDDAIAELHGALAIDGSDAETWDFLGLLHADRSEWEPARAAFDRALELVPGRPQTLFNRAVLRLRLGDLAGGLADYEGRWESPLFTTPRQGYGVPRWRGEPLHGRTLLVHTEQGLGDTLQFIRFIGQARASGAGRVVLECEDSLVRLLSGVAGVDEIVRRGHQIPPVDLHAPLMSLAHFAGVTLDTLVREESYVGVEQLRRQLPPRRSDVRLRVGIVWEASRAGGSFTAKSVPLDRFAPLASRPDIELFSLQKGAGEQTLAASPLRPRIVDLGSRLVDLRDTAEVMSQLDLVISVDTATCHLAGALGIPAWTLLPASADWRWLLDRADSPWYATMRLFRQDAAQDWAPVMARVEAAIDAAESHVTPPRARFAPQAKVSPDAHLLAALQHTEQGEFIEAAYAYNAALVVDPANADVWNNFGVVLAKAEQVVDAGRAFERAVALDAAHPDACRNLEQVRAALRGSARPDPQGDINIPRFAIDWQIGATSGWGIYGLNLVMHTLRRRHFMPVVFHPPELGGATPEQRALLAGIDAGRTEASQALRRGGLCPYPSLHALGNGLAGGSLSTQLHSTRRIGMVFFEDSLLGPDAVARGRTYDRIVAGSTWNEEVLKAHGLEQTALVFQGIDTSVFHPAPREGRMAGRFVVFSGGKLEYRKGQDLVVAAFARFRQRHPEALLMVAWHNHWPQTMAEIVTVGHVRDVPLAGANGQLELVPWLVRHGIPAESVLDLGLVPNAQMAAFVREADVGVFPNRAEGGTNLVAMEALASGVPCILSENTGHLDLTSDDHNIVLHRQGACRPTPSFRGTDGWGESDVDEIVEALEFAHANRGEAQRRAANAAAVMANGSWHHQIDRLFAAIGDVLA